MFVYTANVCTRGGSWRCRSVCIMSTTITVNFGHTKFKVDSYLIWKCLLFQTGHTAQWLQQLTAAASLAGTMYPQKLLEGQRKVPKAASNLPTSRLDIASAAPTCNPLNPKDRLLTSRCETTRTPPEIPRPCVKVAREIKFNWISRNMLQSYRFRDRRLLQRTIISLSLILLLFWNKQEPADRN